MRLNKSAFIFVVFAILHIDAARFNPSEIYVIFISRLRESLRLLLRTVLKPMTSYIFQQQRGDFFLTLKCSVKFFKVLYLVFKGYSKASSDFCIIVT